MTHKETTPGVWPCLRYRGADAARRFLTEVFGFTETLTVRGADEVTIVHAELGWPEGGAVMYGSASNGNHPEMAEPSGIHWVCVYTADPDAVYRRAVAAGARIAMEPYDADYGARNVAIEDPEGNVWTFGTYRGA